MKIRFYCDSPLIPASFGRHDPKSYLSENFNERLEHINFMRNPSHPFIPRELLLFLEKSYARDNQFGPANYALLVHHIAQIIYEVSINSQIIVAIFIYLRRVIFDIHFHYTILTF